MNERQKITIAILVPVIIILFALSLSLPDGYKWYSNDWKRIFLALSIAFIFIIGFEWFWLKERKDLKSYKSKLIGEKADNDSNKETKREETIGEKLSRGLAIIFFVSMIAIYRAVEGHQDQYPALATILKYVTYLGSGLILVCLIIGVLWFTKYIWNKTWTDIISSFKLSLKQELSGYSVVANIFRFIIGIVILVYIIYIIIKILSVFYSGLLTII